MIEEICGTCKFNLYDKEDERFYCDNEDSDTYRTPNGCKGRKEIEGIPAAYDVDERYNSYIKSADVYRQATLIMKGAVKDVHSGNRKLH